MKFKISISLLLIFILVATLLSCKKTIDPFDDDIDDEINFHGERLLMQGRYWNIWMYPGQYNEGDASTKTPTASAERKAAHLKKLEEDFNLKIEYKIIEHNSVLADILCGVRTADLLTMYPHYLYEYYRSALVAL